MSKTMSFDNTDDFTLVKNNDYFTLFVKNPIPSEISALDLNNADIISITYNGTQSESSNNGIITYTADKLIVTRGDLSYPEAINVSMADGKLEFLPDPCPDM